MTPTAWLLAHEGSVRLSIFLGLVFMLASAERALPLRHDSEPARRQAVNAALALINTLLLRFGFPLLAVQFAVRMEADGIGLLPRLGVPAVLSGVVAIALLDLGIYAQHRLMHRIGWLWRLHRVHHSDVAFDLSLALRFHPVEIALSMGVKFALIALVGAPPVAVLVFELALSAGSLWTHVDLALPPAIERAARWIVVTPGLHRIHHSVERDETDSNFGFTISVWDRLFGSFRAASRSDEASMPIGVAEFRRDRDQSLWALLIQPWRRPSD